MWTMIHRRLTGSPSPSGSRDVVERPRGGLDRPAPVARGVEQLEQIGGRVGGRRVEDPVGIVHERRRAPRLVERRRHEAEGEPDVLHVGEVLGQERDRERRRPDGHVHLLLGETSILRRVMVR